MPAHALLETRRASTGHSLEQRLAFWEDYNASILVGLKCSSYSQAGFAATQDNLCLERLRLARIGGNEHVVERDRSMIRAVPKESIFVSLVQGSQSFFYQDNGCNLLQPGERLSTGPTSPTCSVFRTDAAVHLRHSPGRFRRALPARLQGPLKIGAESPVQRLLVRTLGERTGISSTAPWRGCRALPGGSLRPAGEHHQRPCRRAPCQRPGRVLPAGGQAVHPAAPRRTRPELRAGGRRHWRLQPAPGAAVRPGRQLARALPAGAAPGARPPVARFAPGPAPGCRRGRLSPRLLQPGAFRPAFKARYGMTPSEARGR